MEPNKVKIDPGTHTRNKPSAVKAVVSWLIESDREFRVAQTMINEAHRRF